MSLIRIDWDPGPKKIRQFGLMFFLFTGLLSGWFYWRGGPAVLTLLAGIALGLTAAFLPGSGGTWIYKAWMSFALVMGTAVSFVMLAFLYFGMITPLGLLFRIRGRDALRLKPSGDSEWVPLSIPEDKTYYERLF